MDGFGTLSPAADLEQDLMRRYVLPPSAGGPAPMPRGLMPPDMVPPGGSRLSPMPQRSVPPDLQPVDWSQMNRPFGTLSDPRGAVIAGAGKPWEMREGDVNTAMGLGMGFAGGGLGSTPEARAVKGLFEASGREAAQKAGSALKTTYASWLDALEGRRNVPTEGVGPTSGPVQAPGADVSGGAGGVGGDPRDAEAYLQAAKAAGNYSALPGLPTKPVTIPGENGTSIRYAPGPNARAKGVADAYLQAHPELNTYPPVDRYHPVDPEHSKAIAQAYENMADAPNDPAVRASFDAMYNETAAQYEAIRQHHPEMQFFQMPQGYDPYAKNPRLVAKDVAENNRMFFYPTEQGFGTGAQEGIDIANHPAMRPSGYTLADGTPLLNNDLFRIVHDYFGHVKEGYGFRAAGEDNAWRSHAAMYSDLARPAMTSETRGQNSWVNYGPHAEHNKTASGADTKYADQKMGLMPEWTMRDRVK